MWKLIQEINLGFVNKSNIFGNISKVPKLAKMPSIICIVSCLFEFNKIEKYSSLKGNTFISSIKI